ncbi:hypothetical protein VM1G_10811 [Cytospora mali]|uniref:Uncharacterized protein n=1 Tax=Cytospora mali TaxID=578113 RepID=A0A194VJ54_CYTMA|nr:hypothetical protein VM1G_10811 [Valsa mali]
MAIHEIQAGQTLEEAVQLWVADSPGHLGQELGPDLKLSIEGADEDVMVHAVLLDPQGEEASGGSSFSLPACALGETRDEAHPGDAHGGVTLLDLAGEIGKLDERARIL